MALNQTVQQKTLENWPQIQQRIFEYILAVKVRSLEIVYSPLTNPDMLWLLVPLILNLVLLEFYFSRHRHEELGWNTAYGNALVLIFIAVMLAKHLSEQGTIYTDQVKFAIVLIVILVGVSLTIIDYFHWLPKNVAFKISSKIPINYLALVAIVLVYTDLPVDSITASGFVGVLIGLLVLIGLIHIITPKVKETLFPPTPKEFEGSGDNSNNY